MGGQNSAFPTTCWSDILSAQNKESPESRDKLNYLISLYWKPAYVYICLEWKMKKEDAKDLTQEFFLSLLKRESLESVGPEKGRFRHFIKAALKNFMMTYKRDMNRLKRGGGAKLLSLNIDAVDIPARNCAPPDEAFLNEWARTVIDISLQRLKSKLEAEGKGKHFHALSMLYFSAAPQQPSHDEIARTLGIGKFDVGNYVKAARSLFRQMIMEVIREYVQDDSAAEKEFEEIMKRVIYGS